MEVRNSHLPNGLLGAETCPEKAANAVLTGDSMKSARVEAWSELREWAESGLALRLPELVAALLFSSESAGRSRSCCLIEAQAGRSADLGTGRVFWCVNWFMRNT